MSKKDLLHSTDEACLKAAVTGEGAIPLTPELAEQISADLTARFADIEARYPALVEACDYETRLAVTAWVFKNVVAHANDGGSFRYLIYNRLGFEDDAYVPLYNAGGMVISNEFDMSEPEPMGWSEPQTAHWVEAILVAIAGLRDMAGKVPALSASEQKFLLRAAADAIDNMTYRY